MENNKDLDWLKILINLKDEGVFTILICYAGSGDSGSIDHIGYLDRENTYLNEDGSIDTSSYNSWDHIEVLEPSNKEIIDPIIENKGYSILNKVEDWYNNDGGQGVILINTSTGEWYCRNEQNSMSTEEFHHSGNIEE